jgi:hypothetical protein
MIKIILTRDRELLNFIIIKKEVFYSDRKWNKYLRILPKDKDLIKQIKLSRNRIPIFLAELFNLSKKELEEYENAKEEKELMEIIVKDAKLNGCLLVDCKIE